MQGDFAVFNRAAHLAFGKALVLTGCANAASDESALAPSATTILRRVTMRFFRMPPRCGFNLASLPELTDCQPASDLSAART